MRVLIGVEWLVSALAVAGRGSGKKDVFRSVVLGTRGHAGS